MTHAELHMKTRALVGGRGFSFIVTTSSIEQHPGRLEVEWSVCIFLDGQPKVMARALDADRAFDLVKDRLDLARPFAAPDMLTAIGPPPEPEGAP